MKTLIVDDNAIDRRVLRYTLERHGCEVLEAADGEEGYAMAARHRPALIISDALMPKVDGFQFLRRIKNDPELAGIPFVFYSSVYTGAKDEKLALSLGAAAFVVKPKKPEELWAEVTAAMDAAGASGGEKKQALLDEEEEYLRQYSHIVASKIGEKVRELEKAHAAAKQRALNYRNLFDSIRDVIVVTDENRVVLNVNQPALRDTFGYETAEVLGAGSLLFGEEAPEVDVAFSRARRFSACNPQEVTLRRKGGEPFIAEMCVLKRIDEEGLPSGKIVMIRDVTERKRAQEALHRAEEERCLLRAEVACAAEVQSKLLPRGYPEIPGFEIAARCLPAHEVGGDFYDWVEVSPGVMAITLGDVMGNGMAAAILMATVRATMHAVSQQSHPAEALQLAEMALRLDLDNSDSFVTLFHARLDAEARRITFVDCGHGFAFLRRGDGRVEELHPRGLPLGVPNLEGFQEGTLFLEEGDALVLYSDGLIDARPDLALDNGLLAERISAAASAADMVSLLSSIPALEGAPPDDLTVLVVRCKTPLR